MNIALVQLNPLIGDLSGNVDRIETAAQRAAADGADLLVTPELSVCGYPPKDLLLRAGFVNACDRAVEDLAQRLPPHLGVLIGHPHRCDCGPAFANVASLLHQGQVVARVQKTLLPNYDVFDEKRYFQPGVAPQAISFRGRSLGVHICEDAWWGEPETSYHCPPAQQPDPLAQLAETPLDLFINLSASPYHAGKVARRRALLARHAQRHRVPFLFVNQTGGNDDLVFDGHSLLLDATGQVRLQARGFEEDYCVFDLNAVPPPVTQLDLPRAEELLNALTLGLRDYLKKCGFQDCVLGLSGGIDSALAACIAARAVGPEHVHGLLMPSRHSSQHSVDDARRLAESLGVDWKLIPLDGVHSAYEQLPTLGADLSSEPGGLADQNLQARIRGAIVMTRSNRHGWLALATGNKSELAVGYCTLYGDMCGGFAVLSDLYKRDVYALSREVNRLAGREIIPASTLEKPPSAELAPNQVDQDTLPPYDILDGILEGLIDKELSAAELSRMYPPETVKWVLKRLDRNEFKRRQMPPGIKLTPRAFGSGRRMPMAAKGF